MLNRLNRSYTDAFYPDDLAQLKTLFNALCNEFGVLPDTGDAQAVAAELVRLFQTGMTDQGMLEIAMRSRWQDDWKKAS